MYHFLVLVNKKTNNKNIAKRDGFFDLAQDNYINIVILGEEKYKVAAAQSEACFLGDPIIAQPSRLNDQFLHSFTPNMLHDLKGLYYLFLIDHKHSTISIYNSLFSILPLFSYEDEDRIIISSQMSLIRQTISGALEIDKTFVFQQLVFNYPLFDHTIYKKIKLVPAQHGVTIRDSRVELQKHTRIQDYYSNTPEPWKKAADGLSDLFIAETRHYFPDDPFSITFTGGFDGRTLVSCALHANKAFSTYSFGTHRNDDVTVPRDQADALGVSYHPIYLDTREYVQEHFRPVGQELIELTGGLSNYLYVHFLYAAKILAPDTKYMLSGFFGSELFRALHLTGAVTSTELVNFFRLNEGEWITSLKESPKLKYLKKELFKDALDETIEELLKFKKFNYSSDLTLNQFFYIYVFEEIFRKFFGSIISAQMNYSQVRVPFLDFNFIKNLLLTELAGANNDFYTANPLKRFKGQYLYARIIQKSHEPLLSRKTSKGYAPGDLLSSFGKINLTKAFAIKKLKRKLMWPYLDNLSIISGLKTLSDNSQSNAYPYYFNADLLAEIYEKLDTAPEYLRDIYALAMSVGEITKEESDND